MPLQPDFYVDEAGEHRWRVVSPNNEILFASTEGYAERRGAERNFDLLASVVAEIEEPPAEPELRGQAEQRGVTWDLDGARLLPFQQAQYLYNAGIRDAADLATMVATLLGESAGYLRAWHHNVADQDDGTIVVKSTDLGWIQRNVVHDEPIVVARDQAAALADRLFSENPSLAKPGTSAAVAAQLFAQRGFQPWYAYSNGGWKRHRSTAVLAVGNFLAVRLGLGQSYLTIRD